jgi:hypothetical protein
MTCAWFEALSIVHAMAMLSLLEANLVLLPGEAMDGSERKVSEGLVFNFVLCFHKYIVWQLSIAHVVGAYSSNLEADNRS